MGKKYLSTTVVPFLKSSSRGALAHKVIEGETGIKDALLSQEDIDLGNGKLHILRLQAESLIPVEDRHIVELLFGLIGSTCSVGESARQRER